MMISLLHPSRGRPEKAFITANNWMREAGGVAVEHIFSLDKDDPLLSGYNPVHKGRIIVNDNDCVVQATNHAAKEAKGDVLIYLSDDFDCFPLWGEQLKNIINLYQGEFMIKVHDGLQDFYAKVLTIPIMSRPLYNKLGYFFHPDYKSMWVDVDLYEVCDRMGVIKPHREIVFQHNHYCNGKSKRDETYNRSDAHFETGRRIYHRRRATNFA